MPDFAAAARNPDIKGLRVGIPKEYRVEGTAAEIVALWDKGMEMLKAAGAVPVEVSLPHTKYALPAYYIVAPAECSSNLARYDGVRFGQRVPGKDLIEMYENTRGAGFGKEVRRRIMIGTYVLSAGYYDAYYKKAQQIRALIARDFKQAFEKCDVLLTPTAPTAAFAAGEKMDDPVTMYLNDMFTIPASMAGPARHLGAGRRRQGRPAARPADHRPRLRRGDDVAGRGGAREGGFVQSATGRLLVHHLLTIRRPSSRNGHRPSVRRCRFTAGGHHGTRSRCFASHCRGRGRCLLGGGDGASAGLARQADPVDRAVPSRRRFRHLCTAFGGEAHGAIRPAGRDRQSRRRGGHDRCRGRRQGAAGRLHAAVGAVHHTVAANVYKALPYDLERDLVPITGVAYVPDVLVMNPGVPAATLGEFIAYCKANPGKVNYGSSGVGTSRHLAGEIFNAMTGAAMVHVPYKGSGPANAALLAGEISVIFEGLGSSAPYLQSGKFRALGLAAARRSPAFPTSQPWPKPDCRVSNRCPGTACGRRPARRAISRPASRRKSRGPSRRRT